MRSGPAEWVQEAVRGGARVLCGGSRKGSLLEPTVLTGTRPDMKVNCQEIFAPVVTVEPYVEFDEAMRQINSSAYGLQAGIFTRDAKLMFQAFEELEVGGLMAGDVPNVPHRSHAVWRRQRFRASVAKVCGTRSKK